MSPTIAFRCAPAPSLLSSSTHHSEPELSQLEWQWQPSTKRAAGARAQLASISLASSSTNTSVGGSLQPQRRTRRRCNSRPLASARLSQAHQPACPHQDTQGSSAQLAAALPHDQKQGSSTVRTTNSLKLLFAGASSALVSRTFVVPLERVSWLLRQICESVML